MFVQENPFPGLDYAIFFKSVTFYNFLRTNLHLRIFLFLYLKVKPQLLWDTQEQVNLPN